MNQEMVIKLAKDALQITLLISAPMLVVSLVVGVLVSITQVVTSIQDMTLTFVPKVIAVFLVFLFVFPWMMKLFSTYTIQLFGHLERFVL
jgi:flagellar biosynthesis protein FliQ